MSKYKYCGSNSESIESFEDLLNKIVGSEDVYNDEYDEQSCGKSPNCSYCKRNESLRYCGKSYPEIGVYTGDHYDDVIDAIITYLND